MAVLIMALLSAVGLARLGLTAEPIKAELHIGFTRTCFLGINRNDAEASFKAFLTTIGRKRGYDLQPRVSVFEDGSSFESAIKRHELHIAIVDSLQYVSMDIQKIMSPQFVPQPRNDVGRKYALLTRRGSGLNTLGDLKGKEMTRLEMGSATLGKTWLETLLMTSGFGAPDKYFLRTEVVGKPSSAVLPVFFGQKDCCLVDMVGFDVMKELNPQLGAKMQVVVASEPLVDNVLCLAGDGWHSQAFKDDTVRALAELHIEPAGQQILTIFKVAKLAPFQEAYLNNVRTLHLTNEKLRKENNR